MGRGRNKRRGGQTKTNFVHHPTYVLCPQCGQDYLAAHLSIMVETHYQVVYTTKRTVRALPIHGSDEKEQEYVISCGSCEFCFAYTTKQDLERDIEDFIRTNNMLVEGSVPPAEKERQREPLKVLLKKSGVVGDACVTF